MFSFCLEKHKIYQKEFSNYLSIGDGCSDKSLDLKTIGKKSSYRSDICNLWLFESDIQSKRCFIIVPSLFNSPEILFFNKNDNFIEYLKQFGDVYLVEWVSVVKSVQLSDYAKSIAGVLDFIRDNTSNNINLIGHCIGGNIAIFSTFLSRKIHSLTLLTTPWDYSHFAAPLFLAEHLQLKKAISGLKVVPKIYIQILFFMLFPEHYQKKLSKYFALSTIEAKEKYLRIEKWLQSGIDISNSLYEEILEILVVRNSLVNDKFCVDDMKISLENIKIPSFIVSAVQDKIAPPSSIKPLKDGLKNSTMMSVKGGHISYLIDNNKQFKLKYAKWMNGL